MGYLQVVTDGQFGSTGKGAVCGHLLRQHLKRVGGSLAPRLGIRVGGPNAGHTIWSYEKDGTPLKEYKLRCVPIAAVVDPEATFALAAGSEINLDVLLEEMRWLEEDGLLHDRRILVDPSATLLTTKHIEMEQQAALTAKIGSTAKGIGAARSERIWRRAATAGVPSDFLEDHPAWDYVSLVDVAQAARDTMSWRDSLVQIEGTQGYGLGLHTSFYPYATSADCRAIDFLAMAGISPWEFEPDELAIWLVVRTSPIRVAGNSGPMKGETSWDELGLPEERTTVTNKVRRVGEWDPQLVRDALAANGYSPSAWGTVNLAITMLDQICPADAGETDRFDLTVEATDWLEERTQELQVRPRLVTTSPHTAIWF